MKSIRTRLAALSSLYRPLLLTFLGVFLLGLALAFFAITIYRTVAFPTFVSTLTLQFLPLWVRGLLLAIAGLIVLAAGIWKLSNVAIIPISGQYESGSELLLGYRKVNGKPNIVVLSGGPGMLVLAGLGEHAKQMTCITPVQDPVEYYYRAASLFHFENVIYISPALQPLPINVTLDDGTTHNIKQRVKDDVRSMQRSVTALAFANNDAPPAVFRKALDAINTADLIILGPGSLFESILPNLLVPELRDAIAKSKALRIFVCNLMTEPGLTTGFTVAEHIRQVRRYGSFTPDYVLVNAQRIEPEIRGVYEAANQTPVSLAPEEYEETIVERADRVTTQHILIEGAKVVEADLASTVIQSTASLEHPGQVNAVRVLRHDPEKLTAALLQLMRKA